jgi:hypothetical protein
VSLGALVFNKRLAHLHVSPWAHLCLVFDHGYSHARFSNSAEFAENQRIRLNFQWSRTGEPRVGNEIVFLEGSRCRFPVVGGLGTRL